MNHRLTPLARIIVTITAVVMLCVTLALSITAAPVAPPATTVPDLQPIPTVSIDPTPPPTLVPAAVVEVRPVRPGKPPKRITTSTTIPAPRDGDCESWRPLLAKHGIPYDEAEPIMRREAQCSMAINNNPRTRDYSLGPFQVNRFGHLAAAWDRAGFTEAYMRTPEGAIDAAAFLYHRCGWGPWTKPYGCPAGWPL